MIASPSAPVHVTDQTAAAPAAPAEAELPIPASSGQRRLWFLEQMAPGSPLFHMPYRVGLRGPLDRPALERALRTLVERHEALRTHFAPAGLQLTQIVAAGADLALPVVDLAGLGPPRREAELDRRLHEEARAPFDLATGPLLRARLFRLSVAEHVLLLVVHHIASDGWSMGLLFRELGLCYDAYVRGSAPALASPRLQYADFALWQEERLQGDVLQRLVDHWKRRLAGAPALLELPTDRPRPPAQSRRGDNVALGLSSPLVARLKQFGARRGATFFMTLLTGFYVVLHRHSGQTDLVVGSPTAGRDVAGTEEIVGFFSDTVLLRTDLADDPTAEALLARVRAVCLEALDHRELPHGMLVEALQPPRTPEYDPLCQVYFSLQNMPGAPLALSGLEVTVAPFYTGTAKSDLTLSVTEGADGTLEVMAEYARDLFPRDAVQRLLGHYQRVLEAIVANPAQPISRLALLTPAEEHRILVEWNASRAGYPDDACVHHLFEAQVARTPDAVAVVFDDTELTYAALDARASALAAELRALRVGPDVLVAVCVERSLEMMVALLAIHKAGGAYVPLDPTYPSERIAFMLRDSAARVLITQRHLLPALPAHEAAVIFVDAAGSAGVPPAFSPTIRDACAPRPDHLAYVLYTSGSTGMAKGVMVTHRNVVNFFAGMDRVLGRTPGTWLAVTSISFDISVLELFWTLTRGFKVVILADAARLPGPADNATDSGGGESSRRGLGRNVSLVQQLRRHQVTHLQCTPSYVRILASSPPAMAALRGLKTLLLGGEALPASLAVSLLEALPCDIVNLYGPTETTIWSTHHALSREPGAGPDSGIVPIGRPLANQLVYLLNERCQPQPVGVPGEIWIGGDGVARGYWGRTELTQQRFLADPFVPGGRMYRTGDYGRYRGDGVIEFLGRADDQVKIRGHRVELGEIEAELMKHPAVRQAAVVLRTERADDPQLTAYVMPAATSAEPRPEALREFLRRTLPELMVPAVFVALDRFPLTPNGKIDRKALPAPAPTATTATPAFVAPAAGLEADVAAVWAEVLHRDRIGANENFFDLGGHSLQVVQVQMRLRETRQIDVAALTLFQHPTIRALTRFLAGPGATGGDDAFRRRIEDRTRRRQAAAPRALRGKR